MINLAALARRLAQALTEDDVAGFLDVWDNDVPASLPPGDRERLKEAARLLARQGPPTPTPSHPRALPLLRERTEAMGDAGVAVDASAAASAGPTCVRVTVDEDQFRPCNLEVPCGTLVEWRPGRTLGMTHILALGSVDDGLESSPVGPGRPTFTWLFTTPGVFHYHSQIFTFMRGTIAVSATTHVPAAAAAAAAPPPPQLLLDSPPPSPPPTLPPAAALPGRAALPALLPHVRSRAELEWVVAGVRLCESETEAERTETEAESETDVGTDDTRGEAEVARDQRLEEACEEPLWHLTGPPAPSPAWRKVELPVRSGGTTPSRLSPSPAAPPHSPPGATSTAPPARRSLAGTFSTGTDSRVSGAGASPATPPSIYGAIYSSIHGVDCSPEGSPEPPLSSALERSRNSAERRQLKEMNTKVVMQRKQQCLAVWRAHVHAVQQRHTLAVRALRAACSTTVRPDTAPAPAQAPFEQLSKAWSAWWSAAQHGTRPRTAAAASAVGPTSGLAGAAEAVAPKGDAGAVAEAARRKKTEQRQRRRQRRKEAAARDAATAPAPDSIPLDSTSEPPTASDKDDGAIRAHSLSGGSTSGDTSRERFVWADEEDEPAPAPEGAEAPSPHDAGAVMTPMEAAPLPQAEPFRPPSPPCERRAAAEVEAEAVTPARDEGGCSEPAVADADGAADEGDDEAYVAARKSPHRKRSRSRRRRAAEAEAEAEGSAAAERMVASAGASTRVVAPECPESAALAAASAMAGPGQVAVNWERGRAEARSSDAREQAEATVVPGKGAERCVGPPPLPPLYNDAGAGAALLAMLQAGPTIDNGRLAEDAAVPYLGYPGEEGVVGTPATALPLADSVAGAPAAEGSLAPAVPSFDAVASMRFLSARFGAATAAVRRAAEAGCRTEDAQGAQLLAHALDHALDHTAPTPVPVPEATAQQQGSEHGRGNVTNASLTTFAARRRNKRTSTTANNSRSTVVAARCSSSTADPKRGFLRVSSNKTTPVGPIR